LGFPLFTTDFSPLLKGQEAGVNQILNDMWGIEFAEPVDEEELSSEAVMN